MKDRYIKKLDNEIEQFDELRAYTSQVEDDLNGIAVKYDSERSLIYRIFIDYIKKIKRNKDGK